jgi:drug/metabolite transporter (DMT)-like permease
MRKLYLALISLSLIWGTSFLLIKLLVDPLGAWGVVFWRCLFGSITLLVIIMVRKEWDKFRKLPYKMLTVVSLLNNAIPWALIALSETKIGSGYASLLNATTPVWTLVIGFVFFSTKLHIRQWLGIILGFLGIVILTNFSILTVIHQSFIGLFTMLGATICYGFATHLTRRYLKNVGITIISVCTLMISALISFLLVVISNPAALIGIIEINVLFSALALGVFGSGIAYILYYFLIQTGSPEFASLVTYLVPITALLWGFIFLDEQITYSMIGGFTMILVGVYFSSRKPKSSKTGIKAIA